MDYKQEALKRHKEWKGKIEVSSRAETNSRDDLSVAYTPGVAEPCREIAKNRDLVYDYIRKGNLVAVVTDGSAILGLGNIGSEAGMPVMEGKCVLFKNFAGVDAFPICLGTQDVDEIVQTVKNIAPTFGGINLEDISAPRCFEVERRLQEELDIPVFHDDQHGTAIVCSAAMINALRVAEKELSSARIVINGAGSAGIAICKMLLSLGASDIILVDKNGAVSKEEIWLNSEQRLMAEVTNPRGIRGGLAEAISRADAFIGVSAPGVLKQEMVRSMAENAIVFAMANPEPEIYPDEAKAAGALVVGTGRSDYPNQINNVIAFPGIFRGALDARAKRITEEMKKAAAYALANLITPEERSAENIIPGPLDPRTAKAVADAVRTCAEKENM